MATPAGAGYRSPVDLGLGQIPKSTDPELFAEFIPVYNAIHILNAYLDSLRLSLEGGDPEATPSEEFRFTRGFWMEAATDIPQGKIITIHAGKAHLGAGKRTRVVGTGQVVDCFLTGVSLTSALVGEPVRFGMGPAILNISGYVADGEVWATPRGAALAGEFLAAHVDGAVRIGICVENDYIMVVPDYLNL